MDREYFATGDRLEKCVLRDLWPKWKDILRKAGIAVGIIAVISGMLHIRQCNAARDAEDKGRQQGTQEALRQYGPTLFKLASDSGLQSSEERRQRAIEILAEQLHRRPEELEEDMSRFAELVLNSPDTPGLDRAGALLNAEQYEFAETVALRAKDTALGFANPNLNDAVTALQIAALAMEARFKYSRAITHLETAEVLTSKARSPKEWADTQGFLARLQAELGKSEEAIRRYGEVIALREKSQGPEHPDTLTSRNNLATALQEQGKIAEAEAEHRAVLAIQERVLGPEHPDTLQSRNNLATALQAQGKIVEAEAEHRAVLAIRERVQGPEHRATLTSRNNLATALQAQGKIAEGEAEHRAVLAIRERVLGPEHPDTLQSRNNLAGVLQAQGKNAEGEAEHRAVLAIRERVLGPEHPDTLQSRNNLNVALWEQGKKDHSEKEDRAVLTIRERVLGPEHPDTLQSRFNLAVSLRDQQKWGEALAEAERALAGRRKVFGDGHPDTKDAEGLVAEIRQMKAADEGKEGK